jgi:glycosyltransferase involved in cell wall biosynthesis
MRIALVHSFYSSRMPSGENIVVQEQLVALRDAGHDVLLVSQSTDERARRRTYPIEAAACVASGVGPTPEKLLREFRPDVVHIHNLFPNYGTRWLQSWAGPVVVTLHNFRPICIAGTLFRDGDVCTACPDGQRWAGLRHGCFHESRLASAPIAWSHRRGVAGNVAMRRADAVIVLSLRARKTFEDAGLDPTLVQVLPNFVRTGENRPDVLPSSARWLVSGRLTAEKGIIELLHSWPPSAQLDVVGDGPLALSAAAIAGPNVRFFGQIKNDLLRSMITRYVGIIIPSQWYEGAIPMVYLEALAGGTPVIAFDGNSAADDVSENQLGVVVTRRPSLHELEKALASIQNAGAALRAKCRLSFASRFTENRWLTNVERVYISAARRAKVTGNG